MPSESSLHPRGKAGPSSLRRAVADPRPSDQAFFPILGSEVADDLPEAFASVDRNWRYIFANETACRMLRRSREQIVGASVWALFPALKGTVCEEAARRAMEERAAVRCENFFEPLNRWFENRFYPSRDGLSIFVSDITGRKRVEAALRLSEERYALAARAGKVGVWDLDLKTNELYLAPNLKALLGYEDRELANRLEDWCGLVHPDDKDRVLQATRDHLEGRSKTYEVEVRRRHKNGGYRWFLAQGRAVRDDQGGAVRLTGSDTDITDRKRAEESIKTGERKLRALFEKSFDAIALIDGQAVFQELTPGSDKVFGWGPSELVGRSGFEFMHPDFLAYTQERFMGLLQRPGGTEQVEFRYRHKDGSWPWIELTASNFLHDAEIGAIVCNFRDITLRKESEEEVRRLNADLRRSLDEVKTLLDVSPIGIAVAHDREGRNITVNPAGLDLLGLTPGTNASKSAPGSESLPFRIFKDGRELKSEELPMQLAAAQGIETKAEVFQIVRADGRVLDLLEWAAPLRDEQGQLRGSLGIYVDVTERNSLEAAVRESELRFRTMADNVPVLIWMSGTDHGGTYFNKTWTDFTGRTQEQERGTGWLQSVHPEDLPGLKACEEAFHLRKPFTTQFRLRHHTGEYRWMIDTAVPRLDHEGHFAGFIGSCVDITDRKRWEEVLEDSEERLKMALDAGQMGAWEWDIRTGAVKWSPNLEQLHGRPPGSFKGRFEDVLSDVHPDDRPELVQAVEKALQDRSDYHVEYRVNRSDSTVRWMEARGRLFFDPDGRPDRMVGVCMDVTERKNAEKALSRQAEELARSNKDLEQFAFIASHDLKEPLRKISGYSQLLEQTYHGKLDENADKYLGYMEDGVRRMNSIIQDLLAYSRVGRSGLTFEAVDMAGLTGTIVNDLEGRVKERNAVIKVNPLPTILANTSQMQQLMMNLIGNALKFQGDRPPEIHVSAVRRGSGWEFSVKDNGIGIEAQYLERIFVIFQRLHSRNSYPGTGIGLAICKKIVENHGGSIWVESTPGEGSTFFFSLPA